MTESELITLGYRYERANGARAQALRQCFNTALRQTQAPEVREHYIYSFNQGRQEAHMQVGQLHNFYPYKGRQTNEPRAN